MSAGGGEGAVVRQGYLRKLKTMKRKFFVLRGESAHSSPRLEYYESERKFRTGAVARRVLPLRSCFNITRRLDLKQRHVIALYSKEEQFCVVADGEDELHSWLSALLHQHQPHDNSMEELLHPTQHIWQVNVQKKGLGASKNIIGLYNLCLTDKTLSLVKIKANNNVIGDQNITEAIEFSLRNIRRCGDSECFFYMEVGRQTATGAGELWMHTDDANIAQSMHSTIYHAMCNCKDEKEMQPMTRNRSSSATEDTRSTTLPARRSTYSDGRGRAGLVSMDTPAMRSRCDSMPSRTCPPMESERTPSRTASIDACHSGRDETDGEWLRTPRIPEEPDYCDMMHHDIMSMVAGTSICDDSDRICRDAMSASSGSVCSGTPSTDPRFSEYQLEPATAHIALEEERTGRAYSVGSRPAPRVPPSSSDGRLRAYSVGARARPTVPTTVVPAAPTVTHPRASVDDLMELDFSNNSPKTKHIASTPPLMPPPRYKPKIDEYVDMSPRSGYVEMKPSDTKPIPMASSPMRISTPDGYVQMNYGKRSEASRPISICEREEKSEDGSQTIFPMSLDSPASPLREEVMSPGAGRGLNYAALDLEKRPGTATLPPRAYTQIDFARSEKLHADAN